VTSDAAVLCTKTGNAAILRGGSESFRSNTAIAGALSAGAAEAGLPGDAIMLVPTTDREAVRILYYKSRISPHEASLKADWFRIQAATLNEKKARILQKWFKKAKQDVFISIDDTYNSCGILDQ